MRKSVSIISTLILLLVVLAIAAVWQFKRVLADLQLEQFSFRLQKLNFHELRFAHLLFIYRSETSVEKVELQNLHLTWQWQSWWSPQLMTLTVGRAQVVGTHAATATLPAVPIAQPAFAMPQSWTMPANFPEHIHIQELQVKVPCPAGTCSMAGIVDLFKIKTGLATTGVNLELKASPGETLQPEQQLQVSARYNTLGNLPQLDATLTIGEGVDLQLTTRLRQDKEIFWLGKLEGSATYADAWWLSYLQPWNIQLAQETATTSPAPISLRSEWELAVAPLIQLSNSSRASDWKKAFSGDLALDLSVPAPISFPGLGKFYGQITFALNGSAGQINRYALTGELNGSAIAIPQQWQDLGLRADSLQLKIQSKVDAAANMLALPVDFSGSSQGDLQSNVSGHFVVDSIAKKINVEQLALTVKAKQVKPMASVQLNNASLELQAGGYWQSNGFAFKVSAPALLTADLLAESASLEAKAIQLTASELAISGVITQGAVALSTIKIDSEASLSIEKLLHPQLQPSPWQWQGNFAGSLQDFTAAGDLSAGTSLLIKHQLKGKGSELKLEWQGRDIFLLAANPFAETLTAWPPLLTFARGKVTSTGNLVFNTKNNSFTSNSYIQLLDLAGIYDTTTFQGLNSRVKITANEKILQIDSDELEVSEINKGFVLGPLLTSAVYQASWDKLSQGKLELRPLTCIAMEGNISTAAQDFDFSKPLQRFTVQLKDINLRTLLQQYPSAELSGSGLLSGTVPIEISAAGIRINEGMVAAEAPGGQLKYKSLRADNIAKTQPGMKVITTALNDFHYSVLSSQVNYTAEGKLLLAVRLEGSNPALENGRPVNFNVNIEEDIPALLASLQLSGKVTDVIKKRIQERMQKDKAQVKAKAKS